MKFLFRLCALLLLLAFLPSASGQGPSLRVSKIEIKHIGPPATSDELIRANIRVKVGDPYLPLAVDDDVPNLYATGKFLNIQVDRQITPDGVVLTYLLQGNPRLTEIRFQGNEKISDAKLQKVMTSKVGEPMEEQKLFTDRQEMLKLYQKKGYTGTEIKYQPSVDPEAGRATVTFEIKESPRIKIVEVEFPGATAISEKELRRVVKTRRHWFLSFITRKGFFKDDEFEQDKERLREFYHGKGYLDFELKNVQFENPTPNTLVVRFMINEGRQYKIGSVKFTGNKIFTTEQIAQGLRDLQPKSVLVKKAPLGPHGLKMDVGDVFTPAGFLEDIQQVQDFYGSRGYLDVGSARTLNVVRIPNTETGTIDLEFQIDEGQQNRIEKIEIRGNTKTKDQVIRRELAVAPDDVFDMVRVRRSRQRLEQMGYFAKVDARPEATDPPITGRKNLVIGVDEMDTGRLTMGAGFSSDSGLIGFAEITQGNFDLFNPPTFTGGGQKFRLRATIGTEQQDYLLSFIEPWFLGKHLQFSTDLYYRNLNFQSVENLYDERRAGGRLGLTHALGSEFLIGSVGYTLEQVGIIFDGRVTSSNEIPVAGPDIPRTLLREQGYTMLSKIDGSIAWDTRNSIQLANKGQRTELSLELAGPFGGEKNYYKVDLRTHWYFKGPFEGHVLELVGGIGTSDAYGSTRSVPFYDRFYLGGLYSLRGFEYRSVSPREEGSGSREPIGGQSYWFGSAEYSIPLIQNLRFAAFYDIGNVLLDPYSFKLSDFSDNWGLGLRLNIPRLGPLRLDYGIPINYDRFNSGSGRVQFGVSFDRPF